MRTLFLVCRLMTYCRVLTQCRETGSKLFGVSSYKGINRIMGVYPHDPIISQMSHLHMTSCWGLNFQYMNSGGAQTFKFITCLRFVSIHFSLLQSCIGHKWYENQIINPSEVKQRFYTVAFAFMEAWASWCSCSHCSDVR